MLGRERVPASSVIFATLLASIGEARAEVVCPAKVFNPWTRSADGEKCWTVLPSECHFSCCVERCAELRASLPCVRSALENAQLTDVVEPYGGWWVGLYQRPYYDGRARSGWSRWAGENCSSKFNYWDVHEPNDVDCEQENCAVANRPYSRRGSRVSKFSWLDERCDALQTCVCEWPGRPSPTVLDDRHYLIAEAGTPMSNTSGCTYNQELEAFAGFRLLLPLGILLCTAAAITSIIRQRRRRAMEMMSRGVIDALGANVGVPVAIAMPIAHGASTLPAHVTTAVPVAQGSPVPSGVAIAAVQGTPIPGGRQQMW